MAPLSCTTTYVHTELAFLLLPHFSWSITRLYDEFDELEEPFKKQPGVSSLVSAPTIPLKFGPVSTSTTVESLRHSVALAENPRVSRLMVASLFLSLLCSAITLLSPLLPSPLLVGGPK